MNEKGYITLPAARDGQSLVVKLEWMKRELAEWKTADELKRNWNAAEAIRYAALRAGLKDLELEAADVKMLVERNIAKSERGKGGGGRRNRDGTRTKLTEDEKKERLSWNAMVNKCRRVHEGVSDDDFDALREDAKRTRKPLNRQKVRDSKTAKANAERKKKRDAEAKAAGEQAKKASADVIVCECKELIERVEEGGLDAIYTDPPYVRDQLGAYDDLARLAVHALRPGGLLLAVAGHMYLPEILDSLRIPGLTYRWCIATIYASTDHKHIQNHGRKISIGWKPMVVFRRDGGHPQHYSEDSFRFPPHDRKDKEDHEWGQNAANHERIAREWLRPGWKVLDPFCGGGSLLVGAYRAECQVFGADINPAYVAHTLRKLAQEKKTAHVEEPV